MFLGFVFWKSSGEKEMASASQCRVISKQILKINRHGPVGATLTTLLVITFRDCGNRLVEEFVTLAHETPKGPK